MVIELLHRGCIPLRFRHSGNLAYERKLVGILILLVPFVVHFFPQAALHAIGFAVGPGGLTTGRVPLKHPAAVVNPIGPAPLSKAATTPVSGSLAAVAVGLVSAITLSLTTGHLAGRSHIDSESTPFARVQPRWPSLASARRAERVVRRVALMPWKIPNTSRWQWLSVEELLIRERILMIGEYIDERYANFYISVLLYLQSEDATKPIQIYFASPGAQLKPALALYDTINQLKVKCKVTTVAFSLCAGMGAFLLAAGTKGRRFATPNALFLLTQTGLESPVRGQATDIKIETEQMLRDTDRFEKELSVLTGQTVEQIRKDLSRNFYLSADAAVKYGLIDKCLKPDHEKGKKLDQGVRDPWSGIVTKEKVGFGVFADPNQPRTAV